MSTSGHPSRAARDALDIEALQRIISGEESGIAELYDRYASIALGLAVRIVGLRSEAEDIVHDAFLAVVERAEQYRPERGAVSAWILATTRNLAIDRVRGRSRQAQILDEEVRHEPIDAPLNPELDSGLAEETRAVREALKRLSAPQRRTLEEAFFQGLSYPEIATLHGLPLGTVKSRATRALAALREVLDSVLNAPAERPKRARTRSSTRRAAAG